MSKLKVDWVEVKTAKTGRPYKTLTLTTETGEKKDVNIFSSFPDFANIAPGHEIMGTLTQNGKFWNLEPDGAQTTRGGAPSAYKQKLIDDTMTRKEGSIEKTMDRKEEAIAMAGAQRDAVLIVTTYKDESFDDATIKEMIIKWRNWFLSDDFKNIKNIPPF